MGTIFYQKTFGLALISLAFRQAPDSGILRPTTYATVLPSASASDERGVEGSPMRYYFADCVLDTQLYTLARAGTTRQLTPKVFQMLHYLLAHRDRVVSRDELREQVWPDQFISEATLESCIKQTRQALGDSGQRNSLFRPSRAMAIILLRGNSD